jgi:hypothetical protein
VVIVVVLAFVVTGGTVVVAFEELVVVVVVVVVPVVALALVAFVLSVVAQPAHRLTSTRMVNRAKVRRIAESSCCPAGSWLK